jgi:hypothetical protein
VADPAGQLIEPEASETLSNPPDTVGFAAAVCPAAPVVGSVGAAVDRVGWANLVAEFDCDPQVPSVVVQSEDPLEVFATAAVALPVVGSTLTSPEPVEDVLEVPWPEHPA